MANHTPLPTTDNCNVSYSFFIRFGGSMNISQLERQGADIQARWKD